MALSQDKHPATTHPFELPYNGTVLPRFPYYTNQLPYLLQTYTKYNNHHPHSSLPHQEPNPHPEIIQHFILYHSAELTDQSMQNTIKLKIQSKNRFFFYMIILFELQIILFIHCFIYYFIYLCILSK